MTSLALLLLLLVPARADDFLSAFYSQLDQERLESLRKRHGRRGERLDAALREAGEACGLRVSLNDYRSVHVDTAILAAVSVKRFCSPNPEALRLASTIRLEWHGPRPQVHGDVLGTDRPAALVVGLPGSPAPEHGEAVERLLAHQLGHLLTTHRKALWLRRWKDGGDVSPRAARNAVESAAEMYALHLRDPDGLILLRRALPNVEANYRLLREVAALEGIVLP